MTRDNSPRISVEHKFRYDSECWDAGTCRVSWRLTSCVEWSVCGPTADFTLVTPVSSPPCPEKMVQDNYVRTRTYDTWTNFELIFVKFACLMRIHPWVNPVVFRNNRPNRTTNLVENVPTKPVYFAFIQTVCNFLWKKLINSVWYPIPHWKGSTHFCRPTPTLPQKWSCPPKIIFHLFFFFEKYVVFFFWKNCSMKNI